MEKGIIGTVQPVQTSCLGRCNMGPVLLVEPGHYMYAAVNKDGIKRIVEEHILEGKPVEELLISKDFWDEPISPKDMMKQMGRA
jgi:(2Fe-2S) ferredoxin